MELVVLVAYATRAGSTREVAEAVAAELRSHGVDARLQAACEVTDLAPYDAVVLGGALYVGRWHRDARRFLKRHRSQLDRLPLAVFALGPQSLEPDQVEQSRKQLERAVASVRPIATAVFGGVVDPASLPFPFNRMPASDARDWDAIRAWSDELASLLVPTAAAVEGAL
jgi:menaquinone-dependent protoporphyrinogen oxidase